MADTPTEAQLLAESLAWNNPGQPAVGPTFNPPGPQLPSSGRAGFNPGTTDLPSAPVETLEAPQAPAQIPGSSPGSTERQQAVREAAGRNMSDLFYGTAVARNTGAGANNRSQVEVDVASLPHSRLIEKYGLEQANLLRQEYSQAAQRVTDDAGRGRSWGDAALDTAIGVPTGMATGLASLGTLAAGLVDSDAGAAGARFTQGISEWSRGLQSNALQGRARVNETRSRLNQEENDTIREREAITHGPVEASLRSFARGVVNGLGDATSDLAMMADAISQGVGSLLTGSVIGRGVSALGKVLGTTAITPARGVMAAVTGMEAGGAYAGASADIQSMSFEDLERNSPAFRELIKPIAEGGRGLTREETRTALASRGGLTAAAYQAPMALAASRIAARFEAAPTRVRSLGEGARNLRNETFEEFSQEGTGQFSQNIGVQQNADENRSLVQGVGEQAAQGAVAGLGTAGALQAPGIASRAVGVSLRTVESGARSAAATVADRVTERADRVRAENEESSPIGEAALTEVARSYTQDIPATAATVASEIEETSLAPEEKRAAQEYVANILTASELTEADRNDTRIPEAVRTSATDTVSLLFGLANHIRNMPDDSDLNEVGQLGLVLLSRLNGFYENSQADDDLYDSLPEGSVARDVMDRFAKLRANIGKNPKVAYALTAAEKALAAREARLRNQEASAPVTQEDAEAVAGLASLDPSKVDPKVAQTVLHQISGGGIQLTQMQRMSLVQAKALGDAAQAAQAKAVANGHVKPMRSVSDEVLAKTAKDGDHSYRKSAVGHLQGVLKAFQIGDAQEASYLLEDMGKFVQHMLNKHNAMTENFTQGGVDRTYQALQPDRTWKESTESLGITRHNPRSIELAQQIAYEAEQLGAIYNSLVDALPSLGQPRIEIPPLHPELEGNIHEIAKRLRETKPPGTGSIGSNSSDSAPVTKSRITPEQAAKLTDAGLDLRIKRLVKLVGTNQATDEDVKTLEVLEKEFEAREAEAIKAANAQTSKPVKKAEPETPSNRIAPSSGADVTHLYPEIAGTVAGTKVKNTLAQAFKLAKEARTHLAGNPDPLGVTQQTLSSQATFSAWLGSIYKEGSKELGRGKRLTDEIAAEYETFFDRAPAIKKVLNKRLETFLNKEVSKKRNLDRWLEGVPLSNYPEGKFLAITDQSADGQSFKYNEALLDTAILAGFQWLLTAQKMTKKLDAKAVGDILGKPEFAVTQTEIDMMNSGVHRIDMHRGLADIITRYWGFDKPRTVDISLQDGIALSVAGELLQTFNQLEYVKGTLQKFGSGDNTINLWTYEILPETALAKDSNIYSYPDAIEHSVMIEAQNSSYYGDDLPPPPSRTQLNNPHVENTDDAKKMIEVNQKTIYRVNPMMARFYELLNTEEAARDFFGFGNLNGLSLNNNDRISKEGANTAAVSTWQQIIRQLNEMKSIAGEAYDRLPIRYALNVSSAGRLQMQGGMNSQNNKMMREVFLSTWSKLDMNQAESKVLFDLALAQALDIKIHKLSPDVIKSKLAEKLEALQPTQKILEEMQGNDALSSAELKRIKENLTSQGISNLSWALHALVENVKLKNTAKEDLANFETSLYVEADGMTNGVANAMAMFTSGEFTEHWVDIMAKVGLWFDPNVTSSNEHFARDNKDVYETTSGFFQTRLGEYRDRYKYVKGLQDQHDLMLKFIAILLPDAKISDEGVTFERGITKNPVTVTLYGAGKDGIAGKMVGLLLEEVYGRLSLAAEAQRLNEGQPLTKAQEALAMFGKDKDINGDVTLAMQRLDTFNQGIRDLGGKKAVWGKEQQRYFLINKWWKFPHTVGNYKTFTFKNTKTKLGNSDEVFDLPYLNNLRGNVLTLFVNPMHDAIQQTLGKGLSTNVTLVRQATQFQSIVLKHKFQKAVQALLDQKKAEDPSYNKSTFLSREEVQSILDDLNKYAPVIEGKGQRFYISGSEKANYKDINFGMASDNTWETPGMLWAPDNAGVRAIALLNQGFGDGKMIQSFSIQEDVVEGTLPIFDGINMPLDKLRVGAVQANRAVWDSWNGNPARSVQLAFNTFRNMITKEDLNDRALLGELAKVFPRADPELGLITLHMNSLAESLHVVAMEVEARQNVLKGLNLTIEQMAAAQSPFRNNPNGDTLLGSRQEVVKQLNARYSVEMVKVHAKYGYKAPKTPAVRLIDVTASTSAPAPVPASSPTKTPKLGHMVANTGAREIGVASIRKILSKLDVFSPSQRAVLTEIFRADTATKRLQGYKIVQGTPEQILAYQVKGGLYQAPMTMDGATIHGTIVPGEKRIYVPQLTGEVLVHELVHAATFERIQAVKEGLGTKEENEAVERLEQLKASFEGMSLDMLDTPAYEAARQQMNRAASPAEKLNEFMAWTLANRSLFEKTKEIKVPGIAQLLKDALATIKSLIFGRRRMPPVTDGFFDNVLFNSSILMRTQPTVAQVVDGSVLHMSTAYGQSERLVDIDRTFNELITQWVSQWKKGKEVDRQVRADTGIAQGTAIAREAFKIGFNMTPQEQGVFEKIVAALAVNAKIQPAILVEMERLYRHVIQNIDQDSFRKNQDPMDQNDQQRSREMYGVLTGAFGSTARDSYNRSNLLPTFMGLAVVSDEFRNVLSEIQMPSKLKDLSTNQSLVQLLTGWVMNQLTVLSNWLSGTKADLNAVTAQSAFDTLLNVIMENASKKEVLMAQTANMAGSKIDKVNEWVVDAIKSTSTKLLDKSRALSGRAKNPYTKLLAGAGMGLAAITSNATNTKAAEDAVSMVNKVNGFLPMKKLITDIIGRTQSNGDVVDMIKGVRTLVQRLRQEFRNEVPKLLEAKFKRAPTEAQWASMFNTMAKTDLAALFGTYSKTEVLEMLTHMNRVHGKIQTLENALQSMEPKHFSLVQRKAQQLAHYMMTGEPGTSLLRNAYAVAHLFNEMHPTRRGNVSPEFVKQVDELITLYAVRQVSKADRDAVVELIQDEPAGMEFVLSNLATQRAGELNKADGLRGMNNHFKGYVHSEQEQGKSLFVDTDKNFAKNKLKSYVRVADYPGSRAEGVGESKGYYLAPTNAKAPYSQGIFQNVRMTKGGVDTSTGASHNGMNAGLIMDPKRVSEITQRLRFEKGTKENLLPIFNDEGMVVAYERSLDPAQVAKLSFNTQLHAMIGAWRGRQVEEANAQEFNTQLVGKLYDMWKSETTNGATNADQYVNIFDKNQVDPVVWYAQGLLSAEVGDYAEGLFGEGKFMVRKDMLDDALGYPKASVGDFWTGNSRWSENTQRVTQNLMVGMFGNQAYAKFTNAEAFLQGVVKSAKEIIVIKSVVVPVANALSNQLQLIGRGVPIRKLLTEQPKKIAEINMYVNGRLEIVELETELAGAIGNLALETKLNARIKSIEDAHKRLSIWPLIERGEFSSVNEVGLTEDDRALFKGKLVDYVEGLTDKLPKAVRTAGKYALISKDTALFKGLQKSVAYADFVAKAMLYDDMIERQGKSQKEALEIISEEFINYDRLPGRDRGALEDNGLLWFYNFKIRAVKGAASMIRNNPVHALLALMVPVPGIFGGVELPMEATVINKLMDGSIIYSMGPGQGINSPTLNPWYNLVN